MVQTSHMQFGRASTGATIRAFSSLTRRDADAVRATVRAAAGGHSVQEHDDYDGYLSLLIMPEDGARPSYMVAGRTGAVDLAEMQGDEMSALGTFRSIGAAMAILRPALEGAAVEAPTAKAAKLIGVHGLEAPIQAAMRADAEPRRAGWPPLLQAIDDLGAAP